MPIRANFNWKLLIFVVIFFPTTLRLGFWQLDRAEQKRVKASEFEQLQQQQAVDLLHLQPTQWQNYLPAKVMGRFRDEIFLLDNQVYQGKFGYEVIQAVDVLSSGAVLLVSRGFIGGSLDRNVLPEIKTPKLEVLLVGYLYQPLASVELAENTLIEQYPQVIQSPAAEKLYKHIHKSDRIAHPFLLRLTDESPYAYKAHWQIINVTPEKHLGYAVQWFLMAGVLVVMFIAASVRFNQTEASNE